MHVVHHPAPGEPVVDFDARHVRAVALAHGDGEGHVWLLTFEPGGIIDTHVANFDQLFFVVEGAAWVEVDGRRVDVPAASSAILRQGENHSKGSLAGATVLMVQLTTLRA